ncbi:MAG: amino acid--tRNA ligase-related protein, partial [Myxococcota bacterium]
MDYFERMQTRVALLRAIRRFFEERDFTEVDTPVALSAPAPELHIEAPRVDLTLRDGRTERFLQTSPELPMKRLLARGFERIFQVAPTFRDGDESPLHRPEFRMLEWYRRGSSWTSLVEDCEALLVACAQAVG